MKKTKTNKQISYWLRHKPGKANLILDEYGWTDINDILKALNNKLSKEDLIEMNEKSNKKRWEFDLPNNKIRATHGHSLNVKLPLNPETPPDTLFHGTSTKYINQIIKEGLKPKSRKYLHLTDDLSMAIETGHRHGKLVIIEITTKLLEDKKFYNTSKNVWLTTNIESDHINFFPWTSTDEEVKKILKEELLRELRRAKRKEIDAKNLEAIMRRVDNDDVLFYNKTQDKYYQIHLTYTKRNLKGFPTIKEFNSFDEWLENELITENRYYYDI